jgi:hypothetical protein
VCIHRDECACVVSVSDVLCNSQKKIMYSPITILILFYRDIHQASATTPAFPIRMTKEGGGALD